MILSDARILEEIEKGSIVIEPFDREKLGSNSYDVHLGKHLAVYRDRELDSVSTTPSRRSLFLKKALFFNSTLCTWA